MEDLIAEQIVNDLINEGDFISIDHSKNNKELTISNIKATTS